MYIQRHTIQKMTNLTLSRLSIHSLMQHTNYFKKLRFLVSIIVFKLDFPQKNCKSVTDSQALILKIRL